MAEAQVNGEDKPESVRDSIHAAIQTLEEVEEPSLEAEDPPEPEPEAEEIEETAQTAEERSGEDGKAAPGEETEAKEGQDDSEAKEVALAPASWSKEDREAWNDAPDAVKEVVARREAERERKFHDDSRALAPLRTIVNDNEEFFRQRGVAPDEGIRVLIDTAKALRFGTATQKADLLRQIAHDYEVPLEGLIPSGRAAASEDDDDMADPEFKNLRDHVDGRLERIESALTSRQRVDDESRKRTADDTSAAFFSALDTADPKAFPEARYVEEVYPAFDMLVAGELQAGRPLDVNALKDLYSRAAWSVPEVRAKLMQDASAARETKPERRRTRTVKTVSSSASSGSGSAPHSEDLPEKESVRETISRSIAQLTPVP